MLGNTNALINMGGGGDVYIDLFPQINISNTLLSTTSSSITCVPEQHFYFCENRPLDGETIIEFEGGTYTTFNNTLKIKDKDFLNLGKYAQRSINGTFYVITPSNIGGTVSYTVTPNYSFYINVKSIQSNLTGTLWFIVAESVGFQNSCSVYGITFNKNTILSSFHVGDVGSPNFGRNSYMYITPIVINLKN